MRELIQYIKSEYDKWGWIGQRSHDAVGIDKILGLDFIVSCDYGKETRDFFNKNLISLEKKDSRRLSWSNEDLNNNFKGDLENAFMELIYDTGECLNAICYRSIGKLEKLSNTLPQKLKLFAVPEGLKKIYDNKIYIRKKVKKLDISPIPGNIIKLDISLFNKLKDTLGLPFIVQFPFGSSGKNTYKIDNRKKYNKICKYNIKQEVNALKYIEGYCLNINAIIIHHKKDIKVYCTYPSVQLTGLRECSHYPTIFCGNDYKATKNIPESVIRKVKEIVEKVGRWMGQSGYKGIFGMDLIVNREGKVFPIEINPRFQNSTGLFTVLEIIEEKEIPLLLLHIIEFLKEQDKYLRKFNYRISEDFFMIPVTGAQIILHNGPTENIIKKQILPGVYEFEHEKLIYIRSGTALTDCRKENEILITSGVPFKNQVIAPFAPLCKMQFKNRVLSSDCKTLTSTASKIVRSLYQYLEIDYSSYFNTGIFQTEIEK